MADLREHSMPVKLDAAQKPVSLSGRPVQPPAPKAAPPQKPPMTRKQELALAIFILAIAAVIITVNILWTICKGV
ncbi:MAG: hypothetical protein IKN55_04860 [Oscillospiraceae bacterium]|nr:hypothetical protein [Oscillospiraceae bacterium]